MKKDKKIAFLICLVFALSFFYNISQHNEIKRLNKQIEFMREDSSSRSDSLCELNVYRYIKSIKLDCPEIVLRQCLLESGFFTSNLCKTNNNILGMKCAKSRPYTYIGEKNGYANFKNWKSCIDDYKLLQDKHYRGKTKEDYYKWLSKFYAEDPNYIKRLKSIRLKVNKRGEPTKYFVQKVV
jgi:uncharacterized FlgJ-related protein